jgi:hypothetical protein
MAASNLAGVLLVHAHLVALGTPVEVVDTFRRTSCILECALDLPAPGRFTRLPTQTPPTLFPTVQIRFMVSKGRLVRWPCVGWRQPNTCLMIGQGPQGRRKAHLRAAISDIMHPGTLPGAAQN